MTRWDEQEKEKSKSLSGMFFFITIIFSLGFVIGLLFGLSFTDASLTATPPVFGEIANTFHITLYDGIGIKDSVVTSP